MRNKRIAEVGMLAALALILGWVDSMIPLSSALPGLKLGLANLAVVIALYRLGIWHAAAVSAVKVLLSAMLFGGLSGLLYSAAGAAFSLAVMIALKPIRQVSAAGASAAGGAAHIAAQFVVAALLTSTPAVLGLMPPLLAVGTLTGTLLGITALVVMKRLPQKIFSAGNGRKGDAINEK